MLQQCQFDDIVQQKAVHLSFGNQIDQIAVCQIFDKSVGGGGGHALRKGIFLYAAAAKHLRQLIQVAVVKEIAKELNVPDDAFVNSQGYL